MKDPQKELVLAIYNVLDGGSIVWNATSVPTYTVVPDSAEYPYIYVSDTTSADEGCKTSYTTRTSTRIDVVAGSKKRGSRTVADGIATQVTTLLNDSATLTMASFTNCMMRLESIEYREEMSDTDRLIIKGITVMNVIEEN